MPDCHCRSCASSLGNPGPRLVSSDIGGVEGPVAVTGGIVVPYASFENDAFVGRVVTCLPGPVVIVRSSEVYCRKVFAINSLNELRATLNHHRTQGNKLDLLNRDHVDPPNQSNRGKRDEDNRAHEIRNTTDPPDPDNPDPSDQSDRGR